MFWQLFFLWTGEERIATRWWRWWWLHTTEHKEVINTRFRHYYVNVFVNIILYNDCFADWKIMLNWVFKMSTMILYLVYIFWVITITSHVRAWLRNSTPNKPPHSKDYWFVILTNFIWLITISVFHLLSGQKRLGELWYLEQKPYK